MPRATCLLLLACLVLPAAALAAEPDPASLEFFEKDVRPLLAARCQGCHGAEKQKGELRLDDRDALMKGGRSGPAVVPGKPGESLLVDAINYGDVVQMPPKSKLPAPEIATLTKWVEMGAPWPGGHGPATSAGTPKPFNLRERARHWSFQPIADPAVPEVRDASWARTAVDRFVQAKLEAAGLRPAPEADQRTLFRRLSYDLLGLPPAPAEMEAFVADRSPDAYEKAVDRLLASPHYGERWGRHWLDLVRFAETSGHEFDYDIPNAWRYRDYVVRALNADLPYDRFVIEHLAGDLLPDPRRHPTEGTNESLVATGFFDLGEGTHSPVDVHEEEDRRIDGQIDTVGKAFLGLTIACARCHDHKFDALPTRDYYALAGIFKSTRHQQAFLDPPDRIAAKAAELETIRATIPGRVAVEVRPRIADYLLAARPIVDRASVAEVAARAGLDATVLDRLVATLRDEAPRDPGHPLHVWAALAGAPDDQVGARRAEWLAAREGPHAEDVVFADFEGDRYDDWDATGDAFGAGPTRPGEWAVRFEGDRPALRPLPPGTAHSGRTSDRLQGVLRSKSFTIAKRFIHYAVSGRGGRINLVVDGFEKIRDPIYGGLTFGVDHGDARRWVTQDLNMWLGHRAYIEIADGATLDYNGARTVLQSGDGSIAVDEIRFSDRGSPPRSPDAQVASALDDPSLATAEAIARRLEERIAAEAQGIPANPKSGSRLFREAVVLGLVSVRPADGLDERLKEYRRIESGIPAPTLAPAVVDGTGVDIPVHVRGSYKTPGPIVPRRFLEAIPGGIESIGEPGSGRLELARRIVAPSDPFLARVIVNRVWKHHFGEGIVRTPDDFGVMGQPPTNPELLDYLATRFRADGWSLKKLHRSLLLSSVYRMASRPDDAEAERLDPTNALVHRQNVRRLEAEAIRDAVLAVAGRLDAGSMFGPSVPTHLTPFMEGRGRPGRSGPLDGDGRRSLYIDVRRNFLTPMLQAFDAPTPTAPMGRRNVSNVPAQALTLLNDPFILDQARLWAGRVRAESAGDVAKGIASCYAGAFGRPPTETEAREARAFLDASGASATAWADLCHVLLNVKEFLYVN